MTILISSLAKNVIARFVDAFTSWEIWLIMEHLFASKSQAHVMQLQYQITTLKKGSDSIVDYYQKAKLIRDTLAAAGKILSSSDFIAYLLVGLGTNFDSVVTSITTRVNPLTPSQVYSPSSHP